MKAHPTVQGTVMATGAPATAAVDVRSRWLRLARALIVVVTALAIAIASIPLRFASLNTICAADPCATGAFVGQKGRLGPDGGRRLIRAGLSLEAYAAYLTALDVLRIAVGFVPAIVLL